MEKQTLRAETKLPQITMEPPTPQHPVLGSTQSRKSSSWGQDSEDMRESWPCKLIMVLSMELTNKENVQFSNLVTFLRLYS